MLHYIITYHPLLVVCLLVLFLPRFDAVGFWKEDIFFGIEDIKVGAGCGGPELPPLSLFTRNATDSEML